MKKLFKFLALTTVLALASCNGKPAYESGPEKAIKGTGTIFNESLGFNTKDASIFEENGVRYVVYVSNEVSEGDQVFAARKGVLENGTWVYGKKHIVLRGDAESWDMNIYNPSVIKGEFSYQNKTYSYLMAYNGNDNDMNTNNHIGLAVTNDILGSWTKVGDSPILANPEVYEASYGFGGCSLVSFDEASKGYMFYTVGETEITHQAAKAYDFSNLDDIVLERGYSTLPVAGLNDKADVNIISNASLALSKDLSTLYMVRDRLPASGNKPGQTTEVEISKASVNVLASVSERWTNVGYISGTDTMDVDNPDSLGWDQIYSGDFVTDEYGRLMSTSEVDVVYSTFDEESTMVNYSSTLAQFRITL